MYTIVNQSFNVSITLYKILRNCYSQYIFFSLILQFIKTRNRIDKNKRKRDKDFKDIFIIAT